MEPNMVIIGVDYHPSDPYIALADSENGECSERRLKHLDGEAEKFCRDSEVFGYAWGWRSQGIHAGARNYWRNWVSSMDR
jgi:hypothetical protein